MYTNKTVAIFVVGENRSFRGKPQTIGNLLSKYHTRGWTPRGLLREAALVLSVPSLNIKKLYYTSPFSAYTNRSFSFIYVDVVSGRAEGLFIYMTAASIIEGRPWVHHRKSPGHLRWETFPGTAKRKGSHHEVDELKTAALVTDQAESKP